MRLRRTVPCSILLLPRFSLRPPPPRTPRRGVSRDVPFVPTTEEAVAAMLKLADVKKTDIVYDLGCGDGRIVIAAPKPMGRMPSESTSTPCASPRPPRTSRRRARTSRSSFGSKRTTCSGRHPRGHRGDPIPALERQPETASQAAGGFEAGHPVVSNTFDMGDWKPEKEFTVGNPDEESYLSHKLYLWIIPARK